MAVKFTLKQVRSFFLILTFGVLVFAGGYETASVRLGASDNPLIQKFVSNPTGSAPAGADFSEFWNVWGRLQQSYFDPKAIDYQKMTYGSIKGLAQSLGDPYTQYLTPDENKQANENLSGSFYGVGIELGYKDSVLAVVSPIAGSPAEKAGIKAGDLILHIKDAKKNLDVDTTNMTLPTAVTDIRGDKGTVVTLTVLHTGATKTTPLDITRDTITVPSVELSYVKQGGKTIAHLSLHQFGGNTESEWAQKIAEIQANHVDGLVLDLRDNPGGYLDEAVYIVSEFVDSGVVVQQQGRTNTDTYTVNRHGSLLSIPMTVLINGGSASAAEITAGALQDHKRATIVGEQSFGKGTVQEIQDLPDGSSLHVTIAHWLLPSGRWIGKEGITPDMKVASGDDPAKDLQLDAAVKLLVK